MGKAHQQMRQLSSDLFPPNGKQLAITVERHTPSVRMRTVTDTKVGLHIQDLSLPLYHLIT